MPLIGSLVDWTGLRKESLRVRIETSKTERQREKRQKTEQKIQELWDNYKRYNIQVMGIPRREARKEQKKYSKQ